MTSISTSNCCLVQLWVVRCKARSTREEAGGRTWDKATYSFLDMCQCAYLTRLDFDPTRQKGVPTLHQLVDQKWEDFTCGVFTGTLTTIPCWFTTTQLPARVLPKACSQREWTFKIYEGCRYAPSCVLLKVVRFTTSCVQLH